MRLAEDARSRVQHHGPRCSVGEALAEFGDELTEALADLTIPATALEDALRARGWTVSEYTLRRHRNGRCRC